MQVHEKFDENNTKIFQTLKKITQGKDLKIVNLDKKEYNFMDPKAFDGRRFIDSINAEENPMFRYIMAKNRESMCYSSIITLIHSTGRRNGDLPFLFESKDAWAGDRIVICTPQQIDDFPSYTAIAWPIPRGPKVIIT